MAEPAARDSFSDGCLQYWSDETLVIRHGSVWVLVNIEAKTISWECLPGTTSEALAAALEKARRVAIRPEKWPTRRLPILQQR